MPTRDIRGGSSVESDAGSEVTGHVHGAGCFTCVQAREEYFTRDNRALRVEAGKLALGLMDHLQPKDGIHPLEVWARAYGLMLDILSGHWDVQRVNEVARDIGTGLTPSADSVRG